MSKALVVFVRGDRYMISVDAVFLSHCLDQHGSYC